MGLFSWLTGGSGNTKELTALINQVKPLNDKMVGYANYGFDEGKASTQQAKDLLQFPMDFYKKILGGDYNEILKVLNSDEMMKGYDDQARIINEYSPRGGNSAANFSQNEFNKQAQLNETLQKFRAQAPQDLTQISTIFAGLAQQEFQLTGNIQNTINNLFQIESFRMANKAAKAAAIQGIIKTVAAVAGGLAGAGVFGGAAGGAGAGAASPMSYW